jgi:hypothetical protein
LTSPEDISENFGEFNQSKKSKVLKLWRVPTEKGEFQGSLIPYSPKDESRNHLGELQGSRIPY